MKKKHYHFIKVQYGFVKDKDGISLPSYKTLKFTLNHTNRYDNHSHHLARLSKASTMLLNYLVDHADYHDNTVYNTKKERQNLIEFMKKNCGVDMMDDTVKKAFSPLVKEGFLLKYDARALYYINPKYSYRGDEENRRKLLQQLCSHAAKANGSIGIQLRKSLGFKTH